MQVVILGGKVGSDTTLPLFEDKFPSYVDPNKKIIYDDFKSNLGAMSGRITSGKSWNALGSGGALWTAYDGYAAQSSASSASRILLAHLNIGKVCADLEWQSGYIGLLVRAIDASNYHQISINSSGLYYTKVIAGVSTILATKNLAIAAGQKIKLGVEYTASRIKVYVDHTLAADVLDSDLVNASNIGLATSSPLNKILELVGR